MSGTISDETAVDMMKAGAHDYLTKNNLSRLVPALEREMVEADNRHHRRAAEEALRESERRHRMLVESINDTVIVFSPEGAVSEFYSQTPIVRDLTIIGHLGKSIPEIFNPHMVKTISELVQATLDTKITTTFEYPMNGKWFSAKLSPHEDGERAVMVLRDVSDLKQAEEEARQAHGVAMLYQDITGHDIRNLLQAIMIASDLLTSDETDQSKLALLHHVTNAVEETSELITSVQATAALLSTPLEKTSLDFTLKSCVKIFHDEHKDVDVESKVEVSEAVVNADRFLCHMFMNVFSNAVKHNNQNERKVWARLAKAGDGYEITIADNTSGCTTIAFNLGATATSYYFDNIELKWYNEEGGNDQIIEKTPEEKRDTLTYELERWISGIMDVSKDYVKAWDVVNEPMDDGNPSELKTGEGKDLAADEFYWQDYLGKDYAVVAFNLARQYGNTSDKLFINDYNLEYNIDKCKGLIAYVAYIESQGAQVDGIGTQMHISINSDKDKIAEMFTLLAATGKLIKISELDIGVGVKTTEATEADYIAQTDMYKYVVDKYFELIPAQQRYGITVWSPADSPDGSGWRAGEPIGLWTEGYYRKRAYAGFVDGLSGN